MSMRRRRDGNDHCPVCRNSGKITLPLFRSKAIDDPAAASPIRLTYPCPECAAPVPLQNIMFARHRMTYVERGLQGEERERYLQHVREDISLLLGHHLYREGFIDIREVDGDLPPLHRPYEKDMVGTVAVVRPGQAAPLAERIAKAQAHAVLTAAHAIRTVLTKFTSRPDILNAVMEVAQKVADDPPADLQK